MLDLKTVKEITIAEGSVTKITNSSGVVLWQKETGTTASLDVDLNNQWVASTKTLDGYKVYMSNSNHNVDNSYASMKFKFKGQPNFKLWINSYAESNYDYTIAWNLDRDYPTSLPTNSTSGVKANTSGKQYNPTNITAFTEVDYANDGGEHFVAVTYRKDSSVNNNDDRGYVAIKFTLLSTTWVVSSTEFVKKDDKYYEKLTEVGTYTDGSTALTGNYKEGNELTVTYHQGSADDYIVNDGKMYYKNYIYVTPKDQEINTGDYIQGDYIGEATPSMKVTYTDNSEKTFYNLTSINSSTDSNKDKAKEVIIYDGVTNIGNYAFERCSSLTGITLPNSLTSIGDDAFSYCSSLTGITIPDSVTSIGVRAFERCSSLTGITLPNSLTSIGDYAFDNCTYLTNIAIPNSVTSIGVRAFEWCTSLTSVTIPDSVTSIDSGVFSNCNNLTGITIPDSVTSIGEHAFEWCTSLTSVTIPDSVISINNYAFVSCTSLATVIIQNSTSKISYQGYAFNNISPTAKLYVPSNLLPNYKYDSAWSGAFKGGIFEIQIPAMKVTYVDGTEKTFNNLTAIGENTDSNKKNAKSVEIYDSVTEIGNKAFYGCSSLTGITLPNSLTSIGDYAFDNCTYLTNIAIPNSVTSIGDGVFFACVRVTSITLSDSLTTIGEWAFKICANLTSITIPANVTTIGDGVFDRCTSLATITVEATTPPSIGNNFLSTNSLGQIKTNTIYVPASSVDTYKSATNWSAFASKIKAIGT